MKGYTIILVRDLRTGRIANHELFESTAFSAESLAKEISRRIGEIGRKYHSPYYDVWAEGHDSIESIRRDHPELAVFLSTLQGEKTVLLGPEHDQRLRQSVRDVLVRLGGAPRLHDWSVVGSQEFETFELMIGNERLVVEAETFVGLCLRGTANLVDRIDTLVKAEWQRTMRPGTGNDNDQSSPCLVFPQTGARVPRVRPRMESTGDLDDDQVLGWCVDFRCPSFDER